MTPIESTGPRVDLSQGQEAVRTMVERVGEEYTESDRELMLTESEEIHDESRADRLDELFEAARRGFWHCAAEGHLFLEPRGGEEEFGEAMRDSYPDASPAYIDLAASYWTLRVVAGQMESRFAGVGAQQVLTDVCERVGKLFFQDRETALRSVPQLEEAQRQAIEASGAPIDPQQLVGGNPRRRAAGRLPGFLSFFQR